MMGKIKLAILKVVGLVATRTHTKKCDNTNNKFTDEELNKLMEQAIREAFEATEKMIKYQLENERKNK